MFRYFQASYRLNFRLLSEVEFVVVLEVVEVPVGWFEAAAGHVVHLAHLKEGVELVCHVVEAAGPDLTLQERRRDFER